MARMSYPARPAARQPSARGKSATTSTTPGPRPQKAAPPAGKARAAAAGAPSAAAAAADAVKVALLRIGELIAVLPPLPADAEDERKRALDAIRDATAGAA